MSKKSIRETAGYTQRELAKKLGVSRSTLQRFEAGTSGNKKLQQFYARQEKRNIRDEYGFTQKHLAEMLNVSSSTIGRYESGKLKRVTEKSSAVENFYKNMEANSDLLEEFFTARSEAIKRLKEIEGKGAPAESWLKKHTDGQMIPTIDVFGSGRAQVKREIATLETFNELKTSTTKGIEDWKKNLAKASAETSGISDVDENEIYWELYNKIMNNKSEIRKLIAGFSFDSDQVEITLTRLFEKNYILGDDVDSMLNKLKKNANDIEADREYIASEARLRKQGRKRR